MNPSPTARAELLSSGDALRARVSGDAGSLTRTTRDSATHEARRSLVPSWSLLGLLVTAVLMLIVGSDRVAAADPCGANEIVCENQLAGSPSSEWDISGTGDSAIQGFATDISVDQGTNVEFKVDTASTAYHLDIYRLGYYGGAGARKLATVNPSASLPQAQPDCLSESGTGLVDCGNWAVSASWDVPADAVSGIYLAKLIRDDVSSEGSHIAFVVRDDDGASDLLFQTWIRPGRHTTSTAATASTSAAPPVAPTR